ncbi:NAD-dependent epimerase/dehydratase family protein [Vibrio metschnikovii]|nr:NAD-dependent epimerase/dehydratase family protein [Vibrio metschnikovii]EKO3604299.1 NAD-dependent epimerase/dehydratase family protein [Vibrio metschnikovii]EKQ5811751.1 NAD-dependent epimerase/dehydratase family protein [Vibrio metschnikovii]
MSILLTGSSGFIGGHVTLNPLVVRNVVRKNSQHKASVYIIDEFSDSIDWSGAFGGVNAIIHLSGVAHNKKATLNELHSINVLATLHLAKESVKFGVKRFVFVSSIGVNGTSTKDKPFTSNMKVEPHNPYAQSKYEAELGLKKIAEETGLEVVIVRPTLVYGPNAPGNFGMLTRLVSRLPILPFGLANNRRDFIAVQNLADLLVTCATHPNAAGHTFLASDSETVSIKGFTNAMAKGWGKKVVQLPIPVGLMHLIGKVTGKSAMIEQLFGNLEVDSSNIQQVLDWTPPFTMEQAMASLKDSDK